MDEFNNSMPDEQQSLPENYEAVETEMEEEEEEEVEEIMYMPKKPSPLPMVAILVIILGIAAYGYYYFFQTPKAQYLAQEKKYFAMAVAEFQTFDIADFKAVTNAILTDDGKFSMDIANDKLWVNGGDDKGKAIANLLSGNLNFNFSADAAEKLASVTLGLKDNGETLIDAKLEQSNDDLYFGLPSIAEKFFKLKNKDIAGQLEKFGIDVYLNEIPNLWEIGKQNKYVEISEKYNKLVVSSMPKEAFVRDYSSQYGETKAKKLGFKLNKADIIKIMKAVLTEMRTDQELFAIVQTSVPELVYGEYQEAISDAIDNLDSSLGGVDFEISNYIYISNGKVIGREITVGNEEISAAYIRVEPDLFEVEAISADYSGKLDTVFRMAIEDIKKDISKNSMAISGKIVEDIDDISVTLATFEWTQDRENDTVTSWVKVNSQFADFAFVAKTVSELTDANTIEETANIDFAGYGLDIQSSWSNKLQSGVDVELVGNRNFLDLSTATQSQLIEVVMGMAEKFQAAFSTISEKLGDAFVEKEPEPDYYSYDEYDYDDYFNSYDDELYVPSLDW